MSQSEQTRQSDFIEPPMNPGILCLSVSTAAATFDVTGMAGSPGNQVVTGDVSQVGGKNVNPIGHYVTLQADGGDVYIAFGATTASLSAVATTAVTTIANNALATSNTGNGVVKIPSGTERAFKLPLGSNPSTTPWGASSPARYLAFLTASGTATLRIWQSSP